MYQCNLTGHEFVVSKIDTDKEWCVHCLMERQRQDGDSVENSPTGGKQ